MKRKNFVQGVPEHGQHFMYYVLQKFYVNLDFLEDKEGLMLQQQNQMYPSMMFRKCFTFWKCHEEIYTEKNIFDANII